MSDKKTAYDYAEEECRLACKRENPDCDFDSDELDYGCACYKSALKAYRSISGDGHSGTSWGFTKNILIRLLNGLPLSNITDDDFIDNYMESPEFRRNLHISKSEICTRMMGLFKTTYEDGRVVYLDVNRAYCTNAEHPSDTYYGFGTKVVDELFPITMPYYPGIGKYKVFERTFLTDRKNGDFDTKAVLYVVTPEGEHIDVNRYWTTKDEEWVEISKDEFDGLEKKRLDPIAQGIAERLLWTLVSNSASDAEIERRNAIWNNLEEHVADRLLDDLTVKCRFFENPDNWRYNTFGIHQLLCDTACDGNPFEKEELSDIHDYLMDIYNKFLKQE